MRMPFVLSLIVSFAAALPACAQNGDPAEAASHELIGNALRRLNGRFSLEDNHYSIDIKNRVVKLYRLDQGKKLLLKTAIKAQPNLATLNRYNEKVAVTTRAVRYEKAGVFLETGLDCQLGVSEIAVAKFVQRFADEIGRFESYIAKNPVAGVKEDPAPKVGLPAAKQKVPFQVAPNSDDKEFIITFPTNDPDNWQTAWKVVWDMETAKQANDQGFKFPKGRGNANVLFKIKQAYFKPGRKADWIQVIEDAHPSEFYVPYYFRGTRFYDLRGVGGYVTLSPKEGGAVSQVLSKSKRVIAELRDTGPAYKHGNITRRGEELTLFANFAASNYTYMIEYGFKDDGGIVFRHSPTGYNFFNHIDATHMHGCFWRIGMKLGPQGNNDTNQVFISELPTDAKDQGTGGKLDVKEVTQESFHDWNAEAFTRIRVSNPKYTIVPAAKDRPALPISYDLVTVPQGLARHKRFKDEGFTHHDFWITRHDCPEKMYIYLGDHFFPKGVPNPNPRKLDSKNVVLWHSSSALHVPRAEDGILKGNSVANGQATIYWTTFELRPRNLFLTTPLYRLLP